ncbi:MAG: hypothetical protein A2015_16245 [Spirochaetes bacterium GWF1_31_7]|nr:MAG: hypothetical protein A2Y29_11660 [Spirochaetes bacterium GWE2_31_10]OHD52316.1 MAG: hypothetical protein A2015_16245 [Spirochaetes bacterium GWF1_31_7]OHD80355.1 MAG: hypothetical protein A2355_00205 [Spirochaetes bacterium RIFOXYB1_FULL_32_8]HBD95269.1 hypothetical protein [Spirochaetia bacterium]HBI38464.1 hypothetical protein [Spirochaetia bacterium]
MIPYKNIDSFIYHRRDVWTQFETLTNKRNLTFDESIQFGEFYQQIVEDLSISQTHFEDTKIRAYLNTLILRAGCKMYKRDKSPFSKVLFFFTNKLPDSIHFFFHEFLFSILLFLIIVIIGFSIISKTPEYAELLLSGAMYDQAMIDLENLSSFKNFDSIPSDQRSQMSLYIWLNNTKVSLLAFVLGITAGVGTIFILCFNSMMITGLAVIYYLNGHFLDFFSTIMIHGSLELPAIFLASASGLSIGKAMIFPGKQSKSENIKKTVSKAFTLLIGIIILLLIAALIEGLITTRKPDISIRFIIAAINILCLLSYFVYSLKNRLIKN